MPTEKQAWFLTCNAREAFYGGAAGGGKSEALLMAAAQYLDVPGYSSLLLRRTFPELSGPKSLMTRAEQWWRGMTSELGKPRWDEDDRSWYFPCPQGGFSTVKFGHVELEKDKYNYLSHEYQFVGFDELTGFTHSQYEFIGFSRVRRTVEMESLGIPLRTYGASNPGNVGHRWVKERLIEHLPWPDGVALIDEEGDELPVPVFVPATLADNPYLDQKSYRQSLKMMDPVLRAQYLSGNWDAAAGGAQFQRDSFQMLDVEPRPLVFACRHWDTAATAPVVGQDQSPADWTVGALLAITSAGRTAIMDLQRFQATPGTVEARIRVQTSLDMQWGIDRGIAVVTSIEQEPGAAGKYMMDRYLTDVLAGFPALAVRSTGPKEVRSIPLANQVEARNVDVMVAPWNRAFFDEAELFPFGDHDDQVDAVAGAFNVLAGGHTLIPARADVRDLFGWRM